MQNIWRERFSQKLLFILALCALLALWGGLRTARADDDNEALADPPRLQQAGQYNLEYLAPGSTSPKVGGPVNFRFRVTDQAGKPVEGLALNLTAIRNYSGQVTKEYNGPRSPNLGPTVLKPSGIPGEYQASFSFEANGHWYIKVGGESLNGKTALFRQSIQASTEGGSGFSLDWVIWPLVLAAVLGVVGIVRTTGEKFPPVPVEELEPVLITTGGGK